MWSREEFEGRFFSSASEIWWKKKPAIIDYMRGEPTKTGALMFALEHSYFAAHFPRWFGNMVANCPVLNVRQYFIENMFVEEVRDPTIQEGHYESMVSFAVG
jgi:pyrroloquinoline quinone (PQQ) biosynthesis protein C